MYIKMQRNKKLFFHSKNQLKTFIMCTHTPNAFDLNYNIFLRQKKANRKQKIRVFKCKNYNY